MIKYIILLFFCQVIREQTEKSSSFHTLSTFGTKKTALLRRVFVVVSSLSALACASPPTPFCKKKRVESDIISPRLYCFDPYRGRSLVVFSAGTGLSVSPLVSAHPDLIGYCRRATTIYPPARFRCGSVQGRRDRRRCIGMGKHPRSITPTLYLSGTDPAACYSGSGALPRN